MKIIIKTSKTTQRNSIYTQQCSLLSCWSNKRWSSQSVCDYQIQERGLYDGKPVAF